MCLILVSRFPDFKKTFYIKNGTKANLRADFKTPENGCFGTKLRWLGNLFIFTAEERSILLAAIVRTSTFTAFAVERDRHIGLRNGFHLLHRLKIINYTIRVIRFRARILVPFGSEAATNPFLFYKRVIYLNSCND
jgi:hypothetical protein